MLLVDFGYKLCQACATTVQHHLLDFSSPSIPKDINQPCVLSEDPNLTSGCLNVFCFNQHGPQQLESTNCKSESASQRHFIEHMDTALFSPSSLFNDSDNEDQNSCNTEQRTHAFPGMELVIREFSFHELNANLLWPGTFAFAEWLVQNKSLFQGRRILELGSGTGALAIFLQKSFGIDITTSDFDDEEVEENIAHNCTLNGLPVLPHIRHSWGDTFPTTEPDWDLVVASDILLYVKQYPNLIRTLSFLLKSYKQRDEKACPENFRDKKSITLSGKDIGLPWPAFLMSWRRRIGKEEEMLFFSGCEDAGLRAEHLGSRVYCISPLQETNSG